MRSADPAVDPAACVGLGGTLERVTRSSLSLVEVASPSGLGRWI